jgi:lysophospholipase L1-like esterase
MRAPRWLANLGLALASLLVFGGGAELLTRVVDLRPAGGTALANPPWLGDRRLLRDDYRRKMAHAGVLARYYDLYEWDRYLFYRLRRNVDVDLIDVFAPPTARERSHWSVHTNAHGFRSPDWSPAPAPGTVRIAVLGDSSTFGWGVEGFEAYPERLQGALARRWHVDPARVEVLNLGVPGYSTFQGRVLLARTALTLAPDLVVWSYLSNDGAMTGENDLVTFERRRGALGALLEVLHRSRAFETLEAWIAVARAHVAPSAPPDPTDRSRRNVPSYRIAAENMRASIDAARAAGVPIVLVGQCTRGKVAAVMARVAADTGTPYLDATALLDAAVPTIATAPRYAPQREQLAERYGAGEIAAHPRWLAFLPDACHPNPLGHELVADALAGVVAGALPGPPQ